MTIKNLKNCARLNFFFARIKNGKFNIDGLTYSLSTNDFGNNLKHHLHGGVKSYDRINWDTKPLDTGDGVVFSILDPHGAEVRGGAKLDKILQHVL